ncbi:MAG: hypothetical protein KUG75_16390, partial [Pseudomonadales bacterium]|nr:hypothetical protein [Pseudomonadales bacterium]
RAPHKNLRDKVTIRQCISETAFGGSNGLFTGNSDIHTAILARRCAFATWFYTASEITKNVMYAEPDEKRKELKYSWHPSN